MYFIPRPVTLLILFCCCAQNVFAQSISIKKSIANQTTCIAKCTGEVLQIMYSFDAVYEKLTGPQRKNSMYMPSFKCVSDSGEDYYFGAAQEKSGAAGKELQPSSEAFRQAFEKVQDRCRQMEIYYRLKTFEKDSFAGALKIIRESNPDFAAFQTAKKAYEDEIATVYRRNKLPAPPAAYGTAEQNIRKLLVKEMALINGLSHNFNRDTPAGWPVETVQRQVNEMDMLLKEMTGQKLSMEYPASYYYQSVIECALQFQIIKKVLIDDFTPEKQKNDEHANYAYEQMLHQFNHCYVSFFNQFIEVFPYGTQFPLYATPLAPVFVFNENSKTPAPFAGQFADIPYQGFSAASQKIRIPATVNNAVNKYVEFIDESVRVNNNLLNGLMNSRVNLTSFENARSFFYYDDTHQLPRSLYHETTLSNKDLPAYARKSVEAQAEVLFRIMVEMDQLRVRLYQISKDKTYKIEGFREIETIRDRYRILFTTFDNYKERLYNDLKSITLSYTPPAESSWVKSWKALSAVVEADRSLLDTAKKYYSEPGGATPAFALEPHDATVVSAITDEFKNMKGIERIGRSHGLCPYSPYEDICTYAQTIHGYADKYTKSNYHDFIYLYNNTIHEYNRFVTLSKQPFIKNIQQFELFVLVEPYPAKPAPAPSKPNPDPVEKPKPDVPAKPAVPDPPVVIIQRDTVYIHDTIYLEKPPAVGPSFYSLEGAKPNNLILLLDISKSMDTPDRLPLLQSSIRQLVELLRAEDDIALVVFSGTARIELPPSSGKDKSAILKAIAALKPGGKTDINAGLDLAYQTAQKHYKPKGNNRIILATDGEFTLSSAMLEKITQNAQADIQMTVFKFGQKPTPELKKISDKGKGNLVSINGENAAIFMIMEAKKDKR